jgi:uncharacterized protein YjiS (DUF1127 family)
MPAPKPLRPLAQLGRRPAAAIRLAVAAAGVAAIFSRRAGDTLLLWRKRRRQRRALHALSDHMLQDLGLLRGAVVRESGKRFWEA